MYIDWDGIKAIYAKKQAKEAYKRGNVTEALVQAHLANKYECDSLTKSYEVLEKSLKEYKERVSK